MQRENKKIRRSKRKSIVSRERRSEKRVVQRGEETSNRKGGLGVKKYYASGGDA